MLAGEKYQVVVEKILPIGAVVRMPDDTTELIHISQMADSFVDNVENFVTIGSTYEAVVVEGQGKKPIQLSLKHLGLTNSHKFSKPRENKPHQNNRTDADNRYKSHSTPADTHAKDTTNTTRSLDDMLKKAQKDYQDKAGDLVKRDGRGRKRRS